MITYKKDCYRFEITEFLSRKQTLGLKLTQDQLATICGVQKSYFSKVINKRADFSTDQLYNLCEFMELNEDESNYMMLLLEYARSGLAKRKQLLKSKIRTIQKEKLEIKEQIPKKQMEITKENVDQYYLDPYHQLVHMGLTIGKYRKDPDSLRVALNISKNKFASILGFLERVNLISIEKEKLKVLQDSVHLPRETTVYWPWLSLIRSMGLNHCRHLENDKTYNFSVIFSAEEKVKRKIHERFIDFLKDVEVLVTESDEKNLYQMNFDLFGWDGVDK